MPYWFTAAAKRCSPQLSGLARLPKLNPSTEKSSLPIGEILNSFSLAASNMLIF